MEGLSCLGAEVPFFVSIPTLEGRSVYLEGEIDLIGFNEERTAEKLAFASEIVRAVSKREDKTASPVLAEIVRVVSNPPAKR